MNKNFNKKLEDLLKKDSRFVDKEGELLKSSVIDLAYKADAKLVEILLSDKELKEKFFRKIKDVFVFNINDFVAYVQDKNFLANSYTKYKNKIGLNIDGKFLNERNEVALVWPFKDCVLEGGMTKEDEKRKEIFFNEILAQDEIDKLFAPKVLTNWKRYTKKGKEKVKELKRDKDGTIRENLIIKGNNLLALHSLKSQFAGKVKLIYIDPPYNTGNDSFGYNDSFNHSTWLTFMKNRLEAAKELIKDDGVIFVQCDDSEQAYLKVLMDQVFNRENFISAIAVVSNPGGRDYGGIARTHEYLLVYAKTYEYDISNYFDKDKKMPFEDKVGKYDLRELRNRNVKFNEGNRPNLCYPIYINKNNLIEGEDLYEISLEKKVGWLELWPKKSQGVQTVWRWGKDKVKENLNRNVLAKQTKNSWQIVEKYRDGSRMARSVWTESEMRNEFGTLELKKLFGGKKNFDYPKSGYLMKRIIEIGSRDKDIVLDFFAGSGTTGHATLELNKEDGGDRKFILIEQLEEHIDILQKRIQKVSGEYVYCELAKYNEELVEKIQKAKNTAGLLKIWEEMEEKGFLNYNVDIKKIDETMDEFKKLPLNKQKEILFETLDKNQLYVNLSEIEDKEFKIYEKDKKVNKKFYG